MFLLDIREAASRRPVKPASEAPRADGVAGSIPGKGRKEGKEGRKDQQKCGANGKGRSCCCRCCCCLPLANRTSTIDGANKQAVSWKMLIIFLPRHMLSRDWLERNPGMAFAIPFVEGKTLQRHFPTDFRLVWFMI